MIWKRVATAVVLIPAVLALVFAAATSWLAIALAAVMWLALFEFFALGEAIGHRAYKFWTATCAGLLVFVQYLASLGYEHALRNGLSIQRPTARFLPPTPYVAVVLFIFLIGIAVLPLATKRPLVEALP